MCAIFHDARSVGSAQEEVVNMTAGTSGIPEDFRQAFFDLRWQSIESVVPIAVTILEERYDNKHLEAGDCPAWIIEITSKLQAKLTGDVSRNEASRYMRELYALTFLTLLMQYFESPETFDVNLAYQLGDAAAHVEMQANIQAGVHKALDTHLKQLDALVNSDRLKIRSAKLKQEAEAAIKSAMEQHPDRRENIDFIKRQAARLLGIEKRTINKRLAQK